MLLAIPNVLTPQQVKDCRRDIDAAEWVDGRVTAGHQSAQAKNNAQLPQDSPVGQHWAANIVAVLRKNPLFVSATIPLKIFPPLFNRYTGGQAFGTHVDNGMRLLPGGHSAHVRTDISATLFLSDPSEYDGGELTVEDVYGVHKVKLPAGHMVVYPGGSLHHVTPVTRGERVAAFFWVQSMVRDDGERTLMFDLDNAILSLRGENVSAETLDKAAIRLTGIYHNLLRRWGDS